MQVKFPATRAGLEAIERATAAGVNINATVSFTVAQSMAVAEAVERGLDDFERRGGDVSAMSPVCTLMVGRLDDWMRVPSPTATAIAIHPGRARLGRHRRVQARRRHLPGARLPDATARRRLPPPAPLDGARRR